jgi:hypothetical protein
MKAPQYRDLIEKMLDDQVTKKHLNEDAHMIMIRQRGYLTGLLMQMMHENWAIKREIKARIVPNSDTAPIANQYDW